MCVCVLYDFFKGGKKGYGAGCTVRWEEAERSWGRVKYNQNILIETYFERYIPSFLFSFFRTFIIIGYWIFVKIYISWFLFLSPFMWLIIVTDLYILNHWPISVSMDEVNLIMMNDIFDFFFSDRKLTVVLAVLEFNYRKQGGFELTEIRLPVSSRKPGLKACTITPHLAVFWLWFISIFLRIFVSLFIGELGLWLLMCPYFWYQDKTGFIKTAWNCIFLFEENWPSQYSLNI